MLAPMLAPILLCAGSWSPADSIRIVLPEPPSPILLNIAQVAKRQIETRTDATVSFTGEADLNLTFITDPALPSEGYEIADSTEGGIRISGQTEHSVLYGLGKFLRTSGYTPEGFSSSDWRGQSAPQGRFRAVYAATHFNNFYEAAPADEVARYLEDLALWGANTVIVHFPTWSFSGYDDPEAQRNLEQTKALLRAAKAIGMRIGLIQCPNQGFTSAPPVVLAEKNRDESKRRGNAGVNCCPSKPEGKAYLLEIYRRLFDTYKETGLEVLISWPYDEGGCGCEVCAPWGGRAFPELSKEVAALGRKAFPNLEVILSTWLYDLPPSGEWEGLRTLLEKDSGWLDGILCDDHFDFPRYPLDQGVPAGLPLYNFPEISMWGRNPWGAFGANPLPGRYEELWKQTEGKLSGGMPYSEGIFEDLNKTVCFQFYWNGQTTAEETVRDYAAFEFSLESVEQVVEAVRLLESAWLERGPKSEQAFELLEKVDATLPEWARTGWRWRLLYLRGLIDSTLARNGDKQEGEVLKKAYDELTTIYHAELAHPPVRPFRLP